MKPIFPRLILLILASYSCITSAAVYKHIADDGSVFYSDKPLKKGDKAYESQDVMKFKAPPSNKPATPVTPPKPSQFLGDGDEQFRSKKAQAVPYESISISSPQDDSAVRSNDGNVTLQVSLKPALQTEFKHRLVVVMDSNKTQQSAGASATFQNVDRGTHQFRALVEDEKGHTLVESGPISLHIQRFSVIRANKAH